MHFSLLGVCASLLSASTLSYADYTGSNPAGNPTIHPALSEQVPRGEAFNITWKATSEGDVKLTLLRGPTTNCQPLHTIVESISNDGVYEWQVPTDLEVDKTHYGLQIDVVSGDDKGQFQYSPQFGIATGKGGGQGGAVSKLDSSDKETTTSASSATSDADSEETSKLTASSDTVQSQDIDSAAGKASVGLAGLCMLMPVLIGIMV